ncbi:AMP-binding protein [Plantactinospora sp. CA-290183]|uniref:AMP-binding protein n=1 Tax=Plantactinospora sp. CA-290183 TaxID=3240006 RepID=UPI003D8EEEC9
MTAASPTSSPPVLPAHASQQGLLGGGTPAANCGFAYVVTGDLDAERLAAAYHHALTGYDALRLSLVSGPEPGWAVTSSVRAMVHLHPGVTTAGVDAIVRERTTATFDPADGPLGEVHLHRMPDGRWLVTEMFSHLIADGSSLRLLHEHLAEQYRSPGSGGPRAGSYQQVLATTHPAPDAEHMLREQFRGYRTPAAAAVLGDVTGDGGPQEARVELRLTAGERDRLAAAASRSRATLAAAVLAAHAHAVARHLGAGDIVVHVPVDARDPASDATFGQLTVLAPIRLTHDWSDSLRTHLRHTARALLAARGRLTAGLALLDEVGALHRLSDPAATACVVQDSAPQAPDLPGLNSIPVAIPDQHTAGGLTTVVRHDRDTTTITLRAARNSVLYPHLAGIAATMRHVLDLVAEDVGPPLGADAMLPALVRRPALRHARAGQPYPWRPIDHTLLDTLADEHPVVSDGPTTYPAGRLRELALHRLRELAGHGVGGGDIVVVDDATTIGRIASFLAVLGAGAVYVPVSNDTPRQVRDQIIQQSNAAVLLTGDGCRKLRADCRRPAGTERTAGPDDPAYIIFTSGSTGSPKGVIVSRASLSNLAQGEPDRFAIAPGSRVLLIAPPTTDPWLCHVSGALLAGATLVPADLSRGTVGDHLAAGGVTHAFLPVALFDDLAAELSTGRSLPQLHLVATAGDRSRPRAVRRILAHGGLRVVNVYGPTEATVTAAVAELTDPADPAPVGKPIRGLGVRIAIDGVATAPCGVPGELLLTGAGLAQGYLDDPATTARRFTTDAAGTRWYATGDRAHLGTDGQVYVTGRLDRQVKIRGFRVEPGHLEAAAHATGLCGDVYAHVVVQPSGDSVLHLYAEHCPDPAALQDQLRRQVPPALIPARIVAVDQLPRTAAGNVVIEQLPSPPPRAAATAMTGVLADTWAKVLGAAPAPNDDFFACGGDSLQVLRLVRAIRQAGGELTPEDVYQLRTATALHTAVTQDLAAPGQDPASDPAPSRTPLGPAQQWFFAMQVANPRRWHQYHWMPWAVLPDGDDLTRAVHAVVQSTPLLSASITADGIDYRTYPDHAPQSVPVHHPSAGADLDTIVRDLHERVDHQTGRMLTAAALRHRDGSGVLLLVAHHLVVDDWSWHLITDRIRSAAAGQVLRPDTGYRCYVAAIRRAADAGAYRSQPRRWQAVLDAGATTHQGAGTPAAGRLTRTLTFDLRTVAADWGVSQAAALLACLGQALAAAGLPGATVVNLERNGRTALAGTDLSDTVGWLALHHPVVITHEPATARVARGIADLLSAVSDSGVGYAVTRWDSHSTETRIGRIAVNIAGSPTYGTPPAAGAGDLLDRLDRCPVPANSPDNHLPYDASLVLRPGPGDTVTAEFDVADGACYLPFAEEIIDGLTAAPATPAPPITPIFHRNVPVTAMQRLMLGTASDGPGVYRPRQLLEFPEIPTTEAASFADRLAAMLGTLAPFRSRFTDTVATIAQYLAPPTALAVHRRPGHAAAGDQWLHSPDDVDAAAVRHGAAPASLTVFDALDGPTQIGMTLHHAVADGMSNRTLLDLIGAMARAWSTGAPIPGDRPVDGDLDALVKHAAAEQHAQEQHTSDQKGDDSARGQPGRIGAVLTGGATGRPAGESPAAPHGEDATASLDADATRRLTTWSVGHGVDLRSVLAAAAVATAREHTAGPVHLVVSGRTPDIAETMHALGMFWYFTVISTGATGTGGDLVALTRQVHRHASAPLSTVRAAAIQWPSWTRPDATSVNYIKASQPGTGGEPAGVRVTGSRDLFHHDRQLQLLHQADGAIQIRWYCRHGTAPHLLRDYLDRLTAAEEPDRSLAIEEKS